MSSKRSLYLVPRSLDAQIRVLGLPLDEFIPACAMAIAFFLSKKILFSMAVPTVLVVFIKFLKQGQGSAFLVNVCYWFFPRLVMSNLLRHTPPSEDREYIA